MSFSFYPRRPWNRFFGSWERRSRLAEFHSRAFGRSAAKESRTRLQLEALEASGVNDAFTAVGVVYSVEGQDQAWSSAPATGAGRSAYNADQDVSPSYTAVIDWGDGQSSTVYNIQEPDAGAEH